MKKFLLAIIAVGSITAAQAQKGSILVYGDLDLNMDKNDAKQKTNMFSIAPGVGYQVSDNFTVGLSGMYSNWTYQDTGSNVKKDGIMNMRIGVFARYTKYIGNSPFFIYTQLDAGYTSGNTKTGDKVDTLSKHTGFMAGITPAVGINICHGFCLNFNFGGLSFTTDKYKDIPGANPETNINLTFGHQVNFGISKNFGGGHKHMGHHEPMDETRKMDTSDDEDSAPKKKPAKKDDDE